jgi:signal transduction histidine kinase
VDVTTSLSRLLDRVPATAWTIALGAATGTVAFASTTFSSSAPPFAIALCAASAVISFVSGRRTDRRTAALLIMAGGSSAGLAAALIEGQHWATSPTVLALTILLPWLLGRSVRQQSELEATRVERSHLHRNQQIAYELHDTLGHELGLLTIRAGALELDPALGDPQRAAATDLRIGAGAATERLADAVSLLGNGDRPPRQPQPDVGSIPDIVRRCRAAGMEISLTWRGSQEPPAVVDRVLRCGVREGLTNAAKHAPSETLRIAIESTSTATTLSMINRLPLRALPGVGSGVGIGALREQAASIGGIVKVAATEGDYTITMTLPHSIRP